MSFNRTNEVGTLVTTSICPAKVSPSDALNPDRLQASHATSEPDLWPPRGVKIETSPQGLEAVWYKYHTAPAGPEGSKPHLPWERTRVFLQQNTSLYFAVTLNERKPCLASLSGHININNVSGTTLPKLVQSPAISHHSAWRANLLNKYLTSPSESQLTAHRVKSTAN